MDFISEGKNVLESQPFSQLVGAELVELSEGKATLELPIKRELKQSFGFVHGGVVSYMADNTLTFAAATHFGACVTSEFKINYVQPAQGDRLVAEAEVVSVTLRQAVIECKVYAERGSSSMLVAVALGTVVKVETDVSGLKP